MTTTTNAPASPMGPAALQVLGTPELLDIIAKNVISRPRLASLRLVNNTFNSIFTRHLYRHLNTDFQGVLDPEVRDAFRLFLDRSNIRYARSLHVSFFGSFPEVDVGGREACTRELLAVLSQTPTLQEFIFDRPSLEEWPLNSRMLRGLHRSCPRLKAISLDFENESAVKFCRDDHSDLYEEWETQEVPDDLKYSIADVLVFTNLTSIKLFRIQGDLGLWVQTIAQMLGNSPALSELALSISETLVEWVESEGDLLSLFSFLIDVAEQYAKLGHEPLRLRTLELFYPILFRLDTGGKFSYLNKLTDLTWLRTLQIFNSNDMLARIGPFDSVPTFLDAEIGHAWPALTPEIMPNLGRLTISVWDDAFYEWYRHADPAFIGQLELRKMGEMCDDEEPTPLDILSIPSPDQPHKPKGLFLPPLGRPPITSDPLLYVAPGANGRVPIDWERLGKIKEFHCLRTLGIQLDTDEPLDELVAILEQMEGLTQLAIMYVPSELEKAWLEGFSLAETCNSVARRCKGLTYLHLDGKSMEIRRSPAGEVELEEFDQQEDRVVGEFFQDQDFHYFVINFS